MSIICFFTAIAIRISQTTKYPFILIGFQYENRYKIIAKNSHADIIYYEGYDRPSVPFKHLKHSSCEMSRLVKRMYYVLYCDLTQKLQY